MLENIKTYYDSENVCIENLYISICKALNRDYKQMYAYAWNFGYLPQEEYYYEKIKPDRNGHPINSEESYAIEKYCGIDPTWHFNSNPDDFIGYVKKELSEERPVGLGIDIYSCNWHIFYQKFHFVHYCLITGIDETGFICIDDTLDSRNDEFALESRPDHVKIDFETCKQYKDGFITFEIGDRPGVVFHDRTIYLSAIKTLTGYNGFSDFDRMRHLASDVKKKFDIEKELGKAKDPKAIEIVRTFAMISWSRNNYAKFLEDVKENCILDVEHIRKKILESAQLWQEISAYILKAAVISKNEFQKESISEILEYIADLEEKLAQYILHEYETKVMGL